MPNNTKTKYAQLSDAELVVLIQQNQEYLGEVYKRCKLYCIQFMRKMSNNTLKDYELDDVFHDAVLILYEKIISKDFELTSSIQTYLNSVCRFQLLNRFKSNSKTSFFSDNYSDDSQDDTDNPLDYSLSITDSLDPIENEKETLFIAIEKSLEAMKKAGGHCYELLTQFWYHKKSMNDLTTIFGYSNSDNTKNQKSKCQERLKKLAFNQLKF